MHVLAINGSARKNGNTAQMIGYLFEELHKEGVETEMIQLAADAIVLASPTYFADITAEMKALIDRAGMTARANGDMFKRKLGAAIVTRRRGGAIHAFDSINHFFTIGQMIIVGSSYWNLGVGREKGEVAEDVEGIATMRDLGRNMAWLLRKLND